VYAAVTQLGQIFNVPNVAKVLNADIRNDPNSNFIPNPNLTPINP
jgi:hypothetical protein